jgi:hypothetical protein
MVMETISRSGTNFSSKGRGVWRRGVVLEEDIANEKLGFLIASEFHFTVFYLYIFI